MLVNGFEVHISSHSHHFQNYLS